VRVASELAFRTLEGTPFAVNFLLADPEKVDGTLCIDLSSQELSINFDHIGKLVEVLEMAQSEDLFLVAYPRTGKCRGIYRLSLDPHANGCRQIWFPLLVSGSDRIGIFLGLGGQVEVYGRRDDRADADLQLHCSGSRWVQPPLTKLRWSPAAGESRQTVALPVPEWLQPALLTLLERGYSSIVAILPPLPAAELAVDELVQALSIDGEARREALSKLGLEEMRDGLQLGERRGTTKPPGLSIKHLNSVQALVALLRIDGAHIISDDGRLVALGLRVAAGAAARAESHVGSGSSAASVLAERFAGLRVIKVSASGAIKRFPEDWWQTADS
jgi:hypothetical protein